MKNLTKIPFEAFGIRIGYIYKLIGKIGYVTENQEFLKFKEEIDKIKEECRSEVIVLDVTQLIRWDTLSLRVIFPVIIEANKELASRRKPLIGIIGNTETDIFDAASERHGENGSDLIPWFNSLDDYKSKFKV